MSQRKYSDYKLAKKINKESKPPVSGSVGMKWAFLLGLHWTTDGVKTMVSCPSEVRKQHYLSRQMWHQKSSGSKWRAERKKPSRPVTVTHSDSHLPYSWNLVQESLWGVGPAWLHSPPRMVRILTSELSFLQPQGHSLPGAQKGDHAKCVFLICHWVGQFIFFAGKK